MAVLGISPDQVLPLELFIVTGVKEVVVAATDLQWRIVEVTALSPSVMLALIVRATLNGEEAAAV